MTVVFEGSKSFWIGILNCEKSLAGWNMFPGSKSRLDLSNNCSVCFVVCKKITPILSVVDDVTVVATGVRGMDLGGCVPWTKASSSCKDVGVFVSKMKTFLRLFPLWSYFPQVKNVTRE